MCCESSGKIKEEQCGWIYDHYGSKLTCPNGMVGTGFCGTNNKVQCNNGSMFTGIRCCPASRV